MNPCKMQGSKLQHFNATVYIDNSRMNNSLEYHGFALTLEEFVRSNA